MTVGELIRGGLGARSQAWLARELEVTPATVCNWVHDKRTPSLTMTKRIAAALGAREGAFVRAWMENAGGAS